MVGTGIRVQDRPFDVGPGWPVEPAAAAGVSPADWPEGATGVPPRDGWRMPRGPVWRLLAWWDRPWRHLLLAVLLVAAAAAAPLSVRAQLTEIHQWQPAADGRGYTVEEYRRVDFSCAGEAPSGWCATPLWRVRPDQVSGVRLSASDDGLDWRPVPRRDRAEDGTPLPPGVVLFEPVRQRHARFEWAGRVQAVPGLSSAFAVPAAAAAQGVRLEVRWPATLQPVFQAGTDAFVLAESRPGHRVYTVAPGATPAQPVRLAYVLERPAQEWAAVARHFLPTPKRPLGDLAQWIVSTSLPADAPDTAKARAIYEWIGVNLVPVADRRFWRQGLDAVTPVEQVLADGHGDSRALSNLAAHLLRGVGIAADVVELCEGHQPMRPLVPAVFQRTALHLPDLGVYLDPARAGDVAFGRILGADRVTAFNTRTAEVAWVTVSGERVSQQQLR